MRTTLKTAMIIALASVVMISCKKKEDEEEVVIPPSKTAQLTANNWQMTDIKLDPIGISVWDSVPACEKDNIITFVANGTGSLDNGALLCDSTQSQIGMFSWKWLNNENDLQVIDGMDTLLFTSVQITSTTMKGKTKQDQGGGLVNVVVHFTKK